MKAFYRQAIEQTNKQYQNMCGTKFFVINNFSENCLQPSNGLAGGNFEQPHLNENPLDSPNFS